MEKQDKKNPPDSEPNIILCYFRTNLKKNINSGQNIHILYRLYTDQLKTKQNTSLL